MKQGLDIIKKSQKILVPEACPSIIRNLRQMSQFETNVAFWDKFRIIRQKRGFWDNKGAFGTEIALLDKHFLVQ